MVLTEIAVIIYLITPELNQGVKRYNFKTIYPRCFLDDKNHCRLKHNRSFIQYHLNMFRPNGPSSCWQECKINTRMYYHTFLLTLG